MRTYVETKQGSMHYVCDRDFGSIKNIKNTKCVFMIENYEPKW